MAYLAREHQERRGYGAGGGKVDGVRRGKHGVSGCGEWGWRADESGVEGDEGDGGGGGKEEVREEGHVGSTDVEGEQHDQGKYQEVAAENLQNQTEEGGENG